ncbi:peroxiredoxin family protein [Salipaludibacillus sp. CUR1]|nr:peroxiredoxin family protein [Salipaludibacillus sp. CUR1]
MDNNKHEELSVESLDTCQMPFTATRDDFAPLFSAPALINNEMSSVNLRNAQGKWVILFFYASDFTFV